MQLHQYFKMLFLATYLLILILGFMIALPLGFALIGWCFESSLSLRLCAIGSFFGLFGIILNRNNKLPVDILGYILLMLPLINRVAAFPKELGQFIGFYMPAILSLIFFVIYVLLKYRKISD